MDERIERIWLALTEWNPACSCCDGNTLYKDRVNEVGQLIDGRVWDGRARPPAGNVSPPYDT